MKQQLASAFNGISDAPDWLKAADLSPEEERQLWNFGQGRPYRSKPEAYYSIKLVRE